MSRIKQIEELEKIYAQGFLSEDDFKKRLVELTNDGDSKSTSALTDQANKLAKRALRSDMANDMAKGAVSGALIASVVPFVGTAAGAVVGAAVGAYKSIGSSSKEADVLIVTGGVWDNVVSCIDGVCLIPIRKNLTDLHKLVGNVATVSNEIPSDISPYTQIWDIRPGNVFALTLEQQNQYSYFLQNGGGIVLVGENVGFAARNNSILNFVRMMGGGNLKFSGTWHGLWGVNKTQVVKQPFLAPKPILGERITYAAPGGVTSSGTGNFITHDKNGKGTAVVWGKSTLSKAKSGTLIVVFDVNFMQNTFDLPNSQNFTENMIRYVTSQVISLKNSGNKNVT